MNILINDKYLGCRARARNEDTEIALIGSLNVECLIKTRVFVNSVVHHNNIISNLCLFHHRCQEEYVNTNLYNRTLHIFSLEETILDFIQCVSKSTLFRTF